MTMPKHQMTNYAKEIKSRYTTPFSYVLALMGLTNAYIYYNLDAGILVWACAVGGVFTLPVLFFKNKIKHHILQANYIIFLFCTIVTFIAIYTGAIHSNAIWWLGAIPLLASFLLNAFYAVAWFVIIQGIFFITLFCESRSMLPANILLSTDMSGRIIISFTLNAILIFALCILAELIRDRSFKDREELIAKAYQLNQLSSLGKLAAGVAHEINNPLTVIRGAQLHIARQMDGVEAFDKSSILHFVEKIQKNVARIQEVTSLMRSISTRQTVREISDFNINNTLLDVIRMFSEEINNEHIEFVTMLPKEDVVFNGIYTELFQAFFNIIENSVSELLETNQGKKIIQIRLDKNQDSIVAIIQDNGRGISELTRDHIFDPFYTTKPIGRGRGLGLSFSFNVIRNNGGSIELIESSNGAVFKIILPLNSITV